MAQIRRFVLAALWLPAALAGARFTDQDPIRREPRGVSAAAVKERKLGESADFFRHTFTRPGERQSDDKPIRALNVNTVDEVPDGAWFENRHGTRPMSIQELVRGPGNHPPSQRGAWKVTAAKVEGITPGFTIEDAEGRKYLLKFDPPTNPEMATAAEVISTRFFHALGYHVPENHIVLFERSRLRIAPDVKIRSRKGKERPITEQDVDEILTRVSPRRDGRFRAVASLLLEGKPLGPFTFHGVRADDPNDKIPHEHRRELRGLFVFAAWLNHHDAKSLNSLDMLVEDAVGPYVKHHLIDFGSTLGSASSTPKSPRAGNEHLVDFRFSAIQALTLGLLVPRWARADYPDLPAVGRFEWETFKPEDWKPNYPNPAFANRLPDDTFWAARHVMAFSDREIEAVVRTGQFSDPAAARWITRALKERRDRIGRTYLAKVLPLDRFEISGGRLRFRDLDPARREYLVKWHRFDNETGKTTPVADPFRTAREGEYFLAGIDAGDPEVSVSVYVRKRNGRMEIVGVERSWRGSGARAAAAVQAAS